MITLHIAGVGVLGPGLPDWNTARDALRDPARWVPQPTQVPAPQRLPATERRRAGTVVKASIAVADQALAGSGLDEATLATVFSSATGDPLNCHLLCEALAAPERVVSPTRFTNSVHNAPAGYWHIAAHSTAASTSLAAWDASFGAGLLEAAVACQDSQAPVLLVVADMPYPEPLHRLRPLPDVFALALLLQPAGPGRGLQLSLAAGAEATACADAGLEALRRQIPAARGLPLLQALAGDAPAAVLLEAAPELALWLELAPT